MKNKLEPWEEGLAGRMKEHEFSFDPDAMAGFESLLTAETAVAGEAVPASTTPAAASAGGGGGLGIKLIGLLVAALLVGSVLVYLLSGDTKTVSAPAPVPDTATNSGPIVPLEVTTIPAGTPENTAEVSTTLPVKQTSHPAAAPVPATTKTTVIIGGIPPDPAAFAPTIDLPRPQPISGIVTAPFLAARAKRIATLPALQPIRSMVTKQRPLPVLKLDLSDNRRP